MKSPAVLLIDDDRIFSTVLEKQFEEKQWTFAKAGTAEEGLDKLKASEFDVILVDLFLPDRLGVDLVSDIKALQGDTPILIVSVSGEPQHVVSAIKNGASDYVTKPVEFDHLLRKLSEIIEIQNIKKIERELMQFENTGFILGQSSASKQLIHEISRVSNFDTTIFLRGETGVGKSVVAKLIHSLSRRRREPFMEVSCSSVADQILESEFFGYESNDGTASKPGKFEAAHQGTLFLDEIGELSMELQGKLLRFLQGGEFERIGGMKTLTVDTRVIAATNQNVESLIQKGKFREDLFYRLNVLPITIPSLRDRKEDVPVLVDYFIKTIGQKTGKHFEKTSKSVMDRLMEYSWPGNIRELQNVVERAIVLGKEPKLETSDFIFKWLPTSSSKSIRHEEPEFKSLRELEQKTLMDAIKRSSGNIARAARILGISRGTIYRRLRKYDIGLKLD